MLSIMHRMHMFKQSSCVVSISFPVMYANMGTYVNYLNELLNSILFSRIILPDEQYFFKDRVNGPIFLQAIPIPVQAQKI